MASATAAPPDHDAPVSREIAGLLPSWLVSLVFHLSLVLLLALLHVVGDGGWHNTTITLDCQTDGPDGPGEDERLAAAIEVPSELAESEPAETVPPEVASLTPQPLVASQIELVDPSGKSGALAALISGIDELGAGSAPAQTAVFGLAAEGETFVYVFDRSESMTSTLSFTSEGETVFSITPLEAAKTELLRSLGDLNRNQLFHIVFYNHQVWLFDPGHPYARRMVAATSENKHRAASFVGSVYGAGGTRHIKPLEVALKMRPDVIFLLTDGEAKDDPSEAQLAALRRLNDGRTRINVIQFVHTPVTDSKLVRLATENGGRHIFFNIARLGPGMAAVGK
jgi:hypothetical protein